MTGGDTVPNDKSSEAASRRHSAAHGLERTQPLELFERGTKWLLREYRADEQVDSPLSTHDTRIEGIRAAKDRMDDGGYPCLLRWGSDSTFENIYWNPLFERLEVRYDELLGAWAVVPASGYVLFDSAVEKMRACNLARSVQHDYHFKHLDVFTPDDRRQQVVDHRFVERPPSDTSRAADDPNAAADSMLQADTAPDAATPTARQSETDGEEGDQQSIASSPERVLDAAITDLTAVSEVDTAGPVHRYRATGTDNESVNIATVAPAFTSDREVMTAFMSVVTQWEEIDDAAHVTPVHDIGIGPAPWVAFSTGAGPLPEYVETLDFRARLRIICDLASALDMAIWYNAPRRGLCPKNVRLVTDGDTKRATLSGWGLERAVVNALDERLVTPYTAPEQLDGETTPTTGTYQLGALTYRLLVDRVPFDDPVDLEASIRNSALTPPSQVRDVSSELDDVLARAMDPEPRDRYTTATTFRDRLIEALR